MMKRKWSQILKREEGSGLILALMTLMVLSVLGISLGMITVNGFRLSHINRDSTSVYYIAEAGANQAFEDIRSGVMGIYSEETNSSEFLNKVENQYLGLTKVYTDFEPQNGKMPQATIEVVEGEEDNDYILRSTGTIGNASRTVEKPFGVNWVEKRKTGDYLVDTPFDATVVVKNLISIGSNSVIKGLNEGEPGSIFYFAENSIEMQGNMNDLRINLHIPEAASSPIRHNPPRVNIIRENDFINWDNYTQFLNNFPDFETLTVEKKSTFSNNTIDTGGGVKRIYVDNLNLSEGLRITGGGRVDFFVENNLTLRGNINSGESSNARQLQIFHKGNTPNFGGNLNFKGTLFTEKSDIDFTSDAIINGVIIAGGTNFSMSHIDGEFAIIAPYAKISFYNSSSNRFISGFIIADKIDFRQNTEIRLNNTYIKDFPLVIPGFADDEFNENGEVIEPGSILEVR